jgi:hypothetical protein
MESPNQVSKILSWSATLCYFGKEHALNENPWISGPSADLNPFLTGVFSQGLDFTQFHPYFNGFFSTQSIDISNDSERRRGRYAFAISIQIHKLITPLVKWRDSLL